MLSSPLTVVTAVVSAAVLWALPATGTAAGPVPDPSSPPALSAPPASVPPVTAPTVGVTPGSDGATADVGVGDTALQVGVGAGGVTIKQMSPGSRPSAGDSAPIGTPGDRPGIRRGATVAGSGSAALVFGPASGRRERNGRGATGVKRGVTRPSSGKARGARSARRTPTAGQGATTHLSPFVALIDRIPGSIRAGIAALAMIALGVWAAWVRARHRLRRNAFVDPVTGIANAPAFEGLLTRELRRAKRYKRSLALLVVEVSQRHHQLLPLLDQTLRDVTRAIQEGVREGDIVARLGPSRFAIICPEATAAAAETLARSLERRLEEMRLHAAIGTAERQAADLTPGHLLVRAQSALLRRDLAADSRSRRTFLKVA